MLASTEGKGLFMSNDPFHFQAFDCDAIRLVQRFIAECVLYSYITVVYCTVYSTVDKIWVGQMLVQCDTLHW
jgi:hypothetical protein